MTTFFRNLVASDLPDDVDFVVFAPDGYHLVKYEHSVHFKRKISCNCPCTGGCSMCPLLVNKIFNNIHNWLDRHKDMMPNFPYTMIYRCQDCSKKFPHFHSTWSSRYSTIRYHQNKLKKLSEPKKLSFSQCTAYQKYDYPPISDMIMCEGTVCVCCAIAIV